ncbi:uncharacterized protein AMSG_05815 [Thecamonas trahens ATCC 50062]|uniref:Uncharacterized protein n=1 Tax=Thecamonas trahens ATCC 50062 TaxID=461836 RepID=A0A0L0DFG2_THETB|nr:hypothetical protein AMSG_05815 [Thecamonas trahens ATCC 50062]KNC50053.1 hypothetical protein AMSG_05815 [Thecamonas trahens ATCC 50062]|eukprot:XP_013757218.1 hypothetical protein AMSG_05815 [Thecamonas trahens ATCC 50062]
MSLAVAGFYSEAHSMWAQYTHAGLGVASLLLLAVAATSLLALGATSPPDAGPPHSYAAATAATVGDDALRVAWGLLWAFVWFVTDLPMAGMATFNSLMPNDYAPQHGEALHGSLWLRWYLLASAR